MSPMIPDDLFQRYGARIKVREGQEVSSGLKVEQITPNGAILKFQGHRFRKGVL